MNHHHHHVPHDISWWVEGKTDEEAAAKLSEAAGVACEWASKNGVIFDHQKSEEKRSNALQQEKE